MVAGRVRWGWAALVVAAACFGLDTTLSAFALRELRPADLFVTETIVGAAMLWAWLLVHGGYRRPRRLAPHAVLGLIEPGLAYLLFDIGLRRTSAVSAGLLVSTETLFAVVLAVVFLRERLGPVGRFALVAGVAGTLLVSTRGGGGHGSLIGDLWVLIASATGSTYFLVARRFGGDDDTLSGTALQLAIASALAVVYAAVTWLHQPSALLTASPGHLLVAIATGAVGIAVPFYLLNRALETTEGSTAALILNLIPVFAVLTAIALLGETLMLTTVAGGLLIISGLLGLARTTTVELG